MKSSFTLQIIEYVLLLTTIRIYGFILIIKHKYKTYLKNEKQIENQTSRKINKKTLKLILT